MNKRILFLLPLITLIACSPSKNGESLKPPYSDSDTSSEEPLDPALYGTKTVVFKGASNRTGMTQGSQLGDDKFNTAITSLFNEDDPGFLTNLSGASCSFQPVYDSSVTSLTIGTGSKAGNIIFTLSKDIVKLDFVLQTYHKYVEYTQTYSFDKDAEITVEGQHYDMSIASVDNPPENKNESINLANPKKTIEFSNSDAAHRVYVHSITFYYEK